MFRILKKRGSDWQITNLGIYDFLAFSANIIMGLDTFLNCQNTGKFDTLNLLRYDLNLSHNPSKFRVSNIDILVLLKGFVAI